MNPRTRETFSSAGDTENDVDEASGRIANEAEGMEIEIDENDSVPTIVEAVPTMKGQSDTPIKDGRFSRQARFVARRPWLCFGVSFLIATVLSVVGLIVGDFDVAADNAGWRTRGTIIANRHQQVILVLFNRFRLFYEGEEAWEDLTNNVQTGWESDDEDERRRLSSATEEPFQPSSFYLTSSTKRRLQDNNLFSGALEGCNVSW